MAQTAADVGGAQGGELKDPDSIDRSALSSLMSLRCPSGVDGEIVTRVVVLPFHPFTVNPQEYSSLSYI